MIFPHVDHLYPFIVFFPSTETVKTGAKLVPGCDNMRVSEIGDPKTSLFNTTRPGKRLSLHNKLENQHL